MELVLLTKQYDADIAALIRRNLEAARLDIPGTAYYDEMLDHLSAYYDAPGRAYYVLIDEGTAVGGVGLAKFDGLINCCELQKLYLDDSVKGRGLGYMLLDYIEERAAEMGYTVTGTINDESLGIIVPFIDPGETFPNIGEYNVSAIFIQTNPNYNVTVENATINIVPKQLVITVNDAEKYIGTVDPEFTYTVTDTDGNVLDLELDIKIARDVGEKLGTYRIFIHEFNETNYALNEASADGVLTINEKPEPRQFVLGDANGDGQT